MFGSQWVTSDELRFPICKMDNSSAALLVLDAMGSFGRTCEAQ